MSCCSSSPHNRGTALQERLLAARARFISNWVKSLSIHEKFAKDVERAVPWFVSYVLTLGASGRYHHAEAGGLLDHSLQVAWSSSREARTKFANHPLREELVYMAALWGLFHDLGKRSSCTLKCSRCGASLGTETLEEFLNAHEWEGERLPYKPAESCLHTEASRRFFIEWLDRRFFILSDAVLAMLHNHYRGIPQPELAWIDETVHKLNGSDGTEDRLRVHREKILPLLAGGNAPTEFVIAPYFYVLVVSVLHRLTHEEMPSLEGCLRKLDYLVFPEFIALSFTDFDALLQLMRRYYSSQHGALREKDFGVYDLVDELYREGALLAVGPGKRAIVNGRMILRPGELEIPIRLVLLRRSIDGLEILPGALSFARPVVFEGQRPAGVPERIDPTEFHSS